MGPAQAQQEKLKSRGTKMAATFKFADAPYLPFRRGDPDRKRKILEFHSLGYGPKAIADLVGGARQSIHEVVQKAEKEARAPQAAKANPWYQCRADGKFDECIAAAHMGRPEWTTKIAEAVIVREMTQKELDLHTYPHTTSESNSSKERRCKIKAGRRWMQERFTASSPGYNHHGFALFPPSPDIDYSVVNERLPRLLDSSNYQKVLKGIFQSVQGKGGTTSKGDGKRKQAKMLELVKMAETRCTEAKSRFNQFAVHTESKNKTEAHEKVLETASEKALLQEVINHMCENVVRIAEVWPSEHNIPRRAGGLELLAILESLAGAEDQAFHCDSKKPGVTGITSYEQDQFVYVLFFSFCAMRILEDLRKDRLAATEYVRARLAAQLDFFPDKEWETMAETRVWQFLVHEEFKARNVRPFQVVRVPVRKDHTIVMDTRCVHAGAPWPCSNRAYRGHFYGYERDLQKQTPEQMVDKDEYLTVDLCEEDFLPIVGWAQLDKIFKLKAVSRS